MNSGTIPQVQLFLACHASGGMIVWSPLNNKQGLILWSDGSLLDIVKLLHCRGLAPLRLSGRFGISGFLSVTLIELRLLSPTSCLFAFKIPVSCVARHAAEQMIILNRDCTRAHLMRMMPRENATGVLPAATRVSVSAVNFFTIY
jgi:hypothetical protein